MNKFTLFKSMMLACMLFVGMGAWADTVTSTFTSNKWAVGTDEPEWVKTGADATALESSGSARGVQTTLANIKSSGLSLKNTTIKNLGNITGVSLVVSANGTGGSISSVKVGTTNFKCNGSDSYTVGNSTGQTPSFTNATGVSGDIVITFASTATTKSLYVKSITVTYESSDKTPLGKPVNLTYSNVTDRSATLSWDAVANADSYVVKIGETEYDASSNSFNATGLDYSTEYTWSVKALAGDSDVYSDGAYSESSNFTTLDFAVQAGTYNVVPNNVFWGNSSQDGSKSVTANTVFGPVTEYGMTFEMNSNTSTNSYMKSDHCRAYNGYTLTITAPTGYNLTAINFTGSTWVAPTANVGTMSSKSWTGSANEVTFTFSGTSYMSNIQLTYATPATSTDITISAAGYATFFDAEHAYVMPDDCEGYVFTAANGLELAYDAEDVVPAGEPLVIYTVEPGTKTLNFTTSSEETYKSADMNDLCGAATDMSASEMTAANTGMDKFYALSLNAAGEASSVGFYWVEENGAAFAITAGKAYLALPASGSAKCFVFNGETDGINNVEANANDNRMFNLAGQRVNANAKGIVIMNGKKYINK